MDKYNIDGHKLIYHPKRVSDWLDEKQVYPIYVEVSLTSACNHRCLFCAPKFFLDYKPVFMDTPTIEATITNMAKCGVKAIMFGGEGEPLLHNDFIRIVKHAKSCGMDIALTTNGVLFKDRVFQQILPILSWIKFSVDAGEVNTYAKFHGTKQMDFKAVLDNISRASHNKRLKEHNCTIGVQAIAFKENIESLSHLAKLLKYAKPDYFVVKPYSKHEKSHDNTLEHPTKEQVEKFKTDMQQYKRDYEFIYRDISFANVDEAKPYKQCYGKDFIAYIDTLGDVYSCINYIGNPDFCYGNIYKDTFENIWKNKQTINPDLNKCRSICRIDKINRYLSELKSEDVIHRNFI
jgi:radical SAM protein with 4Fe4S-binding SPASM domain